MPNEISYKIAWTSTGMEQVVGGSLDGMRKLSAEVSSFMARLEKKATVADMGQEAFDIMRLKVQGASDELVNYAAGLQAAIRHSKESREETARAADETERLAKAREKIKADLQERLAKTKDDVYSKDTQEQNALSRSMFAQGASSKEVNESLEKLREIQRLREQQSKNASEADEQRQVRATVDALAQKARALSIGADAYELERLAAAKATPEQIAYARAQQEIIRNSKELEKEQEKARRNEEARRATRERMTEEVRANLAREEEKSQPPLTIEQKQLRERLRLDRELTQNGMSRNEREPIVDQMRKTHELQNERRYKDEQEEYRKSVAKRHAATPDNETQRANSEMERMAKLARKAAKEEDELAEALRGVAEAEGELSAAQMQRMEQSLRDSGMSEENIDRARQAAALKESEEEDVLPRLFGEEGLLSGALGKKKKKDGKRPARGSAGNEAKRIDAGAAALELGRGIEDAIAGGAYGGVKGAIMGASNNLSQFGAMFGSTGAIVGSVLSTVAVLGATAVTAYGKWEEGIKDVEAAQEKLSKSIQHQIEMIKTMSQFKAQMERVDEVKGLKAAEKQRDDKWDEIQDLKAEQSIKKQHVNELLRMAGFGPGHGVGDARDAVKDRDLQFAGPNGSLLKINRDILTPDFVAKLQEMQSDAEFMNHEIGRQEQLFQKSRKAVDRERVSDHETEQREAMESRNRAKEEDSDARNARRQAMQQKRSSMQDAKLSSLTDVDQNGYFKDDEGRRAKAASLEKERRERDVQYAQWKKDGLLNEDEYRSMLTKSTQQRDRDIADVFKKPDEQPGTKATPLDIKTTEGMSQFLQALSRGKDDIPKQQLDVQKEIKQAIDDFAAIKPPEEDVKEVRFY